MDIQYKEIHSDAPGIPASLYDYINECYIKVSLLQQIFSGITVL